MLSRPHQVLPIRVQAFEPTPADPRSPRRVALLMVLGGAFALGLAVLVIVAAFPPGFSARLPIIDVVGGQ